MNAFRRWIPGGGIILLLLTLGGCSTFSGWFDGDNGTRGGESPVLWQSEDYFIRIEPQDHTAGTPPPNQQPISIHRDRLRHALGQVRFRQSPRDDWNPLFTKENLSLLGAYLEQGLAQAGPGQDVTFAIESWHRQLFGIRRDLVITGRVFYADGQLNLIFGRIGPTNKTTDSQAELSARNKDIRLNPYVPGLRGVEVASTIRFSAPPGSGVFRPAGLKRRDWLLFSDKALSVRAPAPAGTSATATAEETIPSSQIEDLRREVERLKSRLGEESADEDLQRRLQVIQDLRNKGLISQEEFERKRQEILSGL